MNTRTRHSLPWTAGVLLVLSPLLSALAAPSAAAQVPASLASRIDPVFARWEHGRTPGAAVAVVKDGEVVYQKGYGYANLDYGIPITTETVFDIASVSKHFTAFAIAMLAERGELSLDDQVHVHIPELPDFGTPITVRHLVHHTSGIRDWVELLSMGGFRFDDVIAPHDIMAFMARQKGLNFAPGAEYMYSNTGYNLMAEIVSRVSGRPFAQFMEEEIFRPLGMENTRILVDHQQVLEHRATSYAPNERVDELSNLHVDPPPANGEWRIWVDNTSAPGSSSVMTSVEDMSRWMRNFGTAEIGGTAVLRRMLQPGVLNSGEEIEYAFGLTVDDDQRLTAVSHGGGWRGFRTYLLWFPEEDLAITVLGNSTEFDSGGTAMRVAEAFLGDRLEPPDPGYDRVDPDTLGTAAAGPVASGPLDDYVGEYHSEEVNTSYTVARESGGLVVRHVKLPDQVLTHAGEDRYTAPGIRGELTYSFARDRQGSVVGYSLAGSRFRGVRFDRLSR